MSDKFHQIKLIKLYLIRNFLIKFLQILGGFSVLVFFIDFLEVMKSRPDDSVSLSIVAAIALLKIPSFLNDIVPSMILMSGIACFYIMSNRSEITIIRNCGFSLWQISLPVTLSAMFLGIFWVTAFGELSIKMQKQFNFLENKYLKNELRDNIEPASGIWFKQKNLEKADEEIIIKAQKMFRENAELKNASFWFFDKNGAFYKKIDADKAIINKGFWQLNQIIVNNENLTNQKTNQIEIKSDLEKDFIKKKVLNNFEDVKFFSIFDLPSLIKDMNESGFNSVKFRVYFHSLLCKPIIFGAMVLIGCYFGVNHFRNRNSIFIIFTGIAVGLVFYITSSIVGALGSSGLVPVLASTWLISLIILAIGVLLIYRKENS